MIIVFGLGNPGIKYKNTRHNLGFHVIDCLAKIHKIFPYFSSRFNSQIFLLQPKKGSKVIFAKPFVFMNNSGRVVKRLAEFFKIPSEGIWVIHDEARLPLGRIKISRLKGDGGHKGVKSIVEKLKSKDFIRFRIGTGWEERENKKEVLEKWVLKPFSDKEKVIIDKIIPKAAEAIILALEKGLAVAENEFNKKELV